MLPHPLHRLPSHALSLLHTEHEVYLGDIYPSPGYTSEIIRLWLCRLGSTGSSSPDDDEFLEIEKIEIGEALKMVMSGKIKDAKTQIGILKTAAFLNRL